MIDLKEKNIIVTGASGGIGNSIIKKLNQAGANILASGTRMEKLEELKGKYANIKILNFDQTIKWVESYNYPSELVYIGIFVELLAPMLILINLYRKLAIYSFG